MTVFDSVVESKNITTIYAMHQKLLNMPCRNDTEQFYLLEILFIYILVFVIYFSSLSLSKLKYEILFFHHNMEINHTLGFHGKLTIQVLQQFDLLDSFSGCLGWSSNQFHCKTAYNWLSHHSSCIFVWGPPHLWRPFANLKHSIDIWKTGSLENNFDQ